jgi:NAD+ diphosphatase
VNGGAFFFQGNCLLLPADIPDSRMDAGLCPDLAGEFEAPDYYELPAVDPSAGGAETAGPIGCVSVSPECSLPPRWRALPVRQALSLMGGGMVEGRGALGRLLRAFHIAQWRRESRFCGSCGAANTDARDELARLCPACGRLEYPRIAPAVIVIIINDQGEALLAHNKKFLNGVYSLIAGFNEAGENLEATVAREIREEVNIAVREIRYITSQPWPFPHSLMLGFSARYASGTVRPDGIEIEDARWFSADALPPLPGTGSVSRYLINRWLAGTL